MTVDPTKLTYYNVSLPEVLAAVRSNNNEAGGRKFEQAGVGYIIKTSGYIQDVATLENVPVRTRANGVPLRLADLGTVQMTGESRLGIFDHNGQGEAVGGIVVMRYGENADEVIKRVKDQDAGRGQGSARRRVV